MAKDKVASLRTEVSQSRNNLTKKMQKVNKELIVDKTLAEKAKGEVWESADIYDSIQLSKNYVLLDKILLYAALFYWSISTCSFHFVETAVTEKEHISFLFTWLSEHLFCQTTGVSLGKRSILDLAVLATVYFPEFRPAALDNRNLPTYGYPPAEGVLRPKLLKEYFLFFHKCSSRTASQFTPFSSRKFGPVWFKKSLDPNFQKLNKPELQDIWASYLIARDLPYSILLDESSKCKYGVDHYSPNPKFSFVPVDTNPSSTEFFGSWWFTYINTRDKTANHVLRKISPHVMPLCSSDRQEVAAPRSNDIKGNLARI
ncbi:hypothetical protein R3W88_023792 [Solanum pinnatisectum]|uniref:Uncharacterized protein n=1 Tax=Solanum pinnatisectum TaxID=50273 RepID=A0AAV9M1P8_9SOLN|nr:hypothetical protein R3W88_023792 [Solanum pinnatisectum]